MQKALISKFIHKSERAQELAEFAIVLPLLLLIVFGVLDLGRAFHIAITVANIARERARFGITLVWTPDKINENYAAIESAASMEAPNTIIDPSRLDVEADCGDCSSGDPLSVEATYDFNLLLGSFIPDFPISRAVIMIIP